MLICFAQFSNGQTEDYNALWAEVSKYEKEGLPKSALQVVTSIAEKAKQDNNSSEEIKALLHKSKYLLILEEDAQLKIINTFKSKIEESQAPTKNILENMLATMYWQYFNQHRYQFYERTNTSEKIDDDFRTWDLQTLFNNIQNYYNRSLQNGLILQQVELSRFNTILNQQKDSKHYRPTVFDLLSHNALQFFKTSENSITKPSYAFKIDNPILLGPTKAFTGADLVSRDSTSLQLQALKIYQDLIRFHAKDQNPDALIDVDLQRLEYVYQHATFDNKDEVYQEALQASSKRFKGYEASGLYDFKLASLWQQQGLKYDPVSNETPRWKLKEAIDLCQTVITKFPKSKAAQQCENLMSQIKTSSIGITAETVIPVQQYSKFLISYANLDTLNFEVFKVTQKEIDDFEKLYDANARLKFLRKRSATTKWTSKLKNEFDYQRHSTEVIVPELKSGHYIVLAKAANEAQTFATQIIQVTNFAVVETSTKDALIFQIIDRQNGQPISSVTAKIKYTTNYKNSYRTETMTSNEKGEVRFTKKTSNYYRLSLDLSKGEQSAYFDNFYSSRYYDHNDNKTRYKSFLFSDRSIYRPGQTVYFKSILIAGEKGNSEPLVDETVFATLYNVNGEKLSELDLVSNEFGSVAGEFVLPTSGLNGQYHIEIYCTVGSIRDHHYFTLEEYKRPKFETTFNAVSETYKVNDSVVAKGEALAYAGSAISDAKVTYRVVRKVQYPRWYYWYRPWFQNEPQEIAYGETTTDDKGQFEIPFVAIPDATSDKTSLPIYQYEVTADVTDINGETRSASTLINVGYHTLVAHLTTETQLDKTKKDQTISITTQNLNGEFVPAEGTIKVFKLNAPDRVLRKRPWNAPDYQEVSFEEFKNKFPYESYGNEQNPIYWKKGKLVKEFSFDTETAKTIDLGNMKSWDSGLYTFILETKDKFGQTITEEHRATVYHPKDKQLADNTLFSITTDKASYNADDTVKLTLGSSAEDLTATVIIEKNKKIVNTFIVHLSNTKKVISIPVTDKDVGGFAVHYSYSVFNSYESNSLLINVPYPKSDLQIETQTFRDKLQPGSDETWSFKIKGPKGEQVTSEILASMYDMSLDQFKSHSWNFNPIATPNYYAKIGVNANHSFGVRGFRVYQQERSNYNFSRQQYDQINWFGLYFGNIRYYRRLQGVASGIEMVEDTAVELEEMALEAPSENDAGYFITMKKAKIIAGDSVVNGLTNMYVNDTPETQKQLDVIPIRKNLQETAFFFPQLQTDEKGQVRFSFTSPEALTKWKLQLLAHTKTMESAVTSLESVTQKELMVIPNVPRFLRHGDSITLRCKISNLTDKVLDGKARLQLHNTLTNTDITNDLVTEALEVTKTISIPAKGNINVEWSMIIPEDLDLVDLKFIAQAGDFSDGEQHTVPTLTNRMLVTETLPMWIKSNETRTFTLDKLATLDASKTSTSTLKHHKLTLEMTSNPVWYAVQALPYLMEYPYECNEQTFSRYYANALATHIANSNPKIQAVFEQWKSADVLISNLEKNEALKSIIIQETPWLRDAQNETEQKKRIALLFDLNKMTYELEASKRKLKSNQLSNGAWAWFNGGRPNRQITQHIAISFAHLNHLDVDMSSRAQSRDLESMINKALTYLDAEFVKEYEDIKRYQPKADLSKDHLTNSQLQYLYLRSFLTDEKPSSNVAKIMDYYYDQIKTYWLNKPLYSKGLMALIMHRVNASETSQKILRSLDETSITSEELGMYWKSNTNSWYWYQAPIETQALMIEVFSEIGGKLMTEAQHLETIDNLKIWLLKHKQTNQWNTTKSTAAAVYALLLQGSDWLSTNTSSDGSVTGMVDVIVGGYAITPSQLKDVEVEAGTGYYKTSWNAEEINPAMASVELNKKGNGIAWGSLYWQYFEDLDKITSAETPLSLKKKLFKKTNTDQGVQISEISKGTNLNVGDLIRIRIELRSDRDMEFIHMKDMRASGLEPINVLSSYKWQDGLGYYESTKDASTNFFFDYLPKGVYVFEYDLRVTNSGQMSNGITTIQSMYAPEFSSHSEGVRIEVK